MHFSIAKRRRRTVSNTFFDYLQAKWQEFASGRKVVRYDEADQIMFDIIKDEYNDFNTGTNVRIPTLKTLPAFINKIKGTKNSM